MEQITSSIVSDADVRKAGIAVSDLPFAFDRTDYTWNDKYGITTVPLLVRARNGELFDDRRFKGIFVDDKYRRIVSRYYTVYPNQELDAYLRDNAAKFNLEIKNVYFSHYGDAQYWELLNEEFDEYVEYKGKNDVVKIGAVVRNSLGANVGLGAEGFTWRVSCQNGAVSRGKDFGFALKHVGKDPEKLIVAFEKGLSNILESSKELVEYYRKAASLRMNKKIAEDLKKKRIPVWAYPECVTYDYKTHSPVVLREDDLWKSFNDVTERVWHPERFSNKAKDVGFLNKSLIEIAIHSVIKNAVNGKYSSDEQ